jgi:hypothetical protein
VWGGGDGEAVVGWAVERGMTFWRTVGAHVAAVVVLLSCSGASSEPEQGSDVRASEAPTRMTATVPESTTTTLGRVHQLVFDACDWNTRSIEAGLLLVAAMVYESRDDATARENREWAAAAGMAEQAAGIESTYQPFVEAFNYWRLNARVNASDVLADRIDPQLYAAVEAVSDVCETVGHPTGEDITIPPEIHENTPERGRFSACTDLIFGDDGSVYVAGERYDFSDCDRVTQQALEAADLEDAYRASVDLFFDDAAGPLCWGNECKSRSEFSPY